MKFFKEIDRVIKEVNNIDNKKLKSIDMEYLKCKRVDKYLFMVALFNSVFLTKMWQIYTNLDAIEYPNTIFKCYGVIVIDLDKNRYMGHRMYSFPTNLDLYKGNTNRIYDDIEKQILSNKMTIKFDLPFEINSRIFDTTRPISRTRSRFFNISGSTPSEFYFDIDDFIKNHVEFSDHGFYFNDPYYNRPSVTKETLMNILKCDCKDDNEKKEKNRYHCNCDNRKECGYHHLKKCQCGKWTYYRRDSCMYCYIIYTRSKKIKTLFEYAVGQPVEYDDDDEVILSSQYIKLHTNLSAYIPYFHYNQGTNGLCLGRGGRVIDEMIMDNINPVRIMLSFKANLAFTDHEGSTSYYDQYSDKITGNRFDKYGEYYVILNQVHMAKYSKVNRHVFSMYCYCSQCLFYKIVLLQEKKKLNTKGFETNQSYITSRDAFIMNYKDYLNKSKSRSYRDSYIHKGIKQVINTPPKEQMIFE